MQTNIKYGTLVEIYRNKLLNNTPIQIIHTINKEKVIETSNYTLFCYRGKEFYPKDFENQENLFLGNFIAKIYVDFILQTKNIKLIKKNEKLLNQYLLQEEMYEDLIFLQNILK